MRNFFEAGDLAKQSYDFSKQVNNISLDGQPQNAMIDLNTAGTRNLGDMVTIKLGVGKPGESVKELELLHYRLYFCNVNVRTAVGFLFVSPSPLFQRSGDAAFFRYVPSYSILLKGFWKGAGAARKSLSYHKLYDPGIGLNFSTLDFGLTGAMELGIAGVFSIFQDFLQLGYGINTRDGKPYAFFGFKLPVGATAIR